MISRLFPLLASALACFLFPSSSAFGQETTEAKPGKIDSTSIVALHDLGWSAADQKAWKQSVEHINKARRSTADLLAKILPPVFGLEQRTQLPALFERELHKSLSLASAAPKEAITASAEWLLNGKAVIHQSLLEQHILAREAEGSDARRLVEDLQDTRARLAALAYRLPGPGMEKEYQQEMQQLKAGEKDLTKKLAVWIGRPFRASPWVALDELRAKLSPTTVFVDMARFPVFDFTAKQWQKPRYAAWIIPPQGKGDVQLVDLGEAEAIEQLVEQTRKALSESARTIVQIGEPEASAAFGKVLQALSAKVLHPLDKGLAKYENWIVSPDGALWLLPWNALLLPDGKFAVENHRICQVVSGRDLVQELPQTKSEAAAVFADPDHDLPPHKVMELAGVQDKKGKGELRSAGAARNVMPRVPALPGTALEAEAIKPKMKQWLGAEARIFLGGRASEAHVKAVKNPRVLHLATHGYFLSDQEAAKNGLTVNALLRCGLLLAGCNKSAAAKAGEEDGILTGLEIVGMNLSGCELVVLSSDQTALGDVHPGEGVEGLRQAFQFAGAKAVLASLWSVPDRETALLMNAFYGELAKGRSQAEALRQAQLQRIAARRDQFGAAHPFYWSAFALTSRSMN